MIKILDVYSGSEVDTYLRKFSNIIQDVDIPMSPRGVHNEQEWQDQAMYEVSRDAYNNVQNDPYIRPAKLGNIFGETLGGKYIKETLVPLLGAERFYTNCYVPGGFVGWHTDCDTPGWFMMFSYSPEDDSKFYWIENNQVQVLNEPKGWIIKAGQITEQPPHLWHATLAPSPKWTALLMWDSQEAWQRACDVVTTKSSLDPVPGLILYGIFE
jgi:hypothetical protein